jgi:hypothetical protein
MTKDGQQAMDNAQLYPLRFEPVYQYRVWGGRRLASLLSAPLPGEGPIGEAWVLSDRTDHQSRIANGPLRGQTLGQVMKQFPEALMGKLPVSTERRGKCARDRDPLMAEKSTVQLDLRIGDE